MGSKENPLPALQAFGQSVWLDFSAVACFASDSWPS